MNKKKGIEVSICCAFYNRSQYVKESIDSLLNQNYDSFEVIVINDGSTDPKTKEILDAYQDSRLNVIHQKNSGFVASIKNAIDLAKGKYIAIHGAGDVSYQERIKEQASYLNTHQDTVAVSCFFENTVFGGKNHGQSKRVASQALLLSSENFLNGVNPLSHGEVMFRKSTYQEVGGYREQFTFAQDIDLWLRMIELGSISIVPNVLYQRREFTKDGVSTSRNKLILQSALASFAKQCFYARQKEGKDLIQQHGHLGLFFRKKDAAIAKFCALQAIECIYQNKYDDAVNYCDISLNEKVTILGSILKLALICCKNKLFQVVLKKLIGFHPRANSWNRN
jgi:glycosyltransferase involved in cell wall biosynthesis